MRLTLTKKEAIENSKLFLMDIHTLENKYGVSLGSDDGDIYLTYKTNNVDNYWGTIDIGWDGDGTPLNVTETEEYTTRLKTKALEKLTEEEIEALGL